MIVMITTVTVTVTVTSFYIILLGCFFYQLILVLHNLVGGAIVWPILQTRKLRQRD